MPLKNTPPRSRIGADGFNSVTTNQGASIPVKRTQPGTVQRPIAIVGFDTQTITFPVPVIGAAAVGVVTSTPVWFNNLQPILASAADVPQLCVWLTNIVPAATIKVVVSSQQVVPNALDLNAKAYPGPLLPSGIAFYQYYATVDLSLFSPAGNGASTITLTFQALLMLQQN